MTHIHSKTCLYPFLFSFAGRCYRLNQLHTRPGVYKYSFIPNTIVDWNALPSIAFKGCEIAPEQLEYFSNNIRKKKHNYLIHGNAWWRNVEWRLTLLNHDQDLKTTENKSSCQLVLVTCKKNDITEKSCPNRLGLELKRMHGKLVYDVVDLV